MSDISKLNLRSSSTPERALRLKGPAGQLESMLSSPANDTGSSVAILAHPHPLHGGSMNNKVIFTLSKTLTGLGIPSIRFNFRGVGNSQGEYADGIGETDDLLTVAAFAQKYFPGRRIWLAGFSFGSYITLKASKQLNIDQLITIAPAVHLFDFQALEEPQCPWLIIQGEEDEVVPSQDVLSWANALHTNPDIHVFPETSHFFHRKLGLLQKTLETYLTQTHEDLAS